MDGSEQRGCSSLVVSVAGRDALPVRALPYVTGWLISPDIVASNFARSEKGPSELLENTDSYHLVGERVVKLLPKEWDRYVVALRALSAELYEQFADHDRGYEAWRRGSVAKLPAGAFVWLDEFIADFTEDYSPGRRAIAGEREGDREVNLSPYLEPEILEMALDGWLYSQAEAPLAHGVEGTQDESPKVTTASCNTSAVTARAASPHQRDYNRLATPAQLVAAFGGLTGMKREWFADLRKGHPLREARKADGKPGRGSFEPLFDIIEVAQWLADKKPRFRSYRHAGKKSVWNIVRQHFPKAYALVETYLDE